MGKLLYVSLFVTIQVAALIVMFLFFRDQFAYFYIFCMLLSLGASIHILNNTTSNPAYKIAWLIPILLFPIFGGLLYLLFGKYRMTRKQRASSRAIRKQIATVMESEHPGPVSFAGLRFTALCPYPNGISPHWRGVL